MELPPNLLELDPPAVTAYRKAFPIDECGEPLAELPSGFLRLEPHPYTAAGAPYTGSSPYSLRVGVIERLQHAAALLQTLRPGHRLLVADCYRPLAVQAFMIEHSIDELARAEQLDPASSLAREGLRARVMSIWAQPDPDPKAPPPHSTGAAIDLTIADPTGRPLEMGSALDALPPLCLPNHYATARDQLSTHFHKNRELLRQTMCAAGFVRLPWEWWHFSFGDQWWGLLNRHSGAWISAAQYGRADLVR